MQSYVWVYVDSMSDTLLDGATRVKIKCGAQLPKSDSQFLQSLSLLRAWI